MKMNKELLKEQIVELISQWQDIWMVCNKDCYCIPIKALEARLCSMIDSFDSKKEPKFKLGQKVFVADECEILYYPIVEIEESGFHNGSLYCYTLKDGQSWLESELFGSEKEIKDYFYNRINELVRKDKERD